MAYYNGKKVIGNAKLDLGSPVYGFAKSEYEKSCNLVKRNSATSWNFLLEANIESGKTYTISFYCEGHRNFSLRKNDATGTIITTKYDWRGNYKYTFTADWTGDLYVNGWTSSVSPTGTSFENIMLNEGTEALPYKPYNGKIIHKKDIEPVTLFKGRSKENITLTDNWYNYGKLRVTFEDKFSNSNSITTDNRHNLVSLNVQAIDTWESENWCYLNNITIGQFNAKEFQILKSGRWYRYQNGAVNVERENHIYITEIVGYREG